MHMILDLDRYQLPEPYPVVHGLRPDNKLLNLLMEGYCGGISEMTTVLQYAYHSLQCQKRYRGVSEMMRGIFYVETMHMELLGKCVCALGADPLYILPLGEKSLSWQSSLVEYAASPDRMLLADIEGEKQAVAYYTGAAESCGHPELAALFLRLAGDETLHVHMLTDLYRRTFRR